MKNARKIFTSVLATYMLALIFMPCNDACDSPTPSTFQSSKEHHEQDNDICSPFCSCACCSTFVTIVHFEELKTFVQTGGRDFSLLKQFFISAYADDCWQPPRLS